jgi:hypothetical protein
VGCSAGTWIVLWAVKGGAQNQIAMIHPASDRPLLLCNPDELADTEFSGAAFMGFGFQGNCDAVNSVAFSMNELNSPNVLIRCLRVRLITPY